MIDFTYDEAGRELARRVGETVTLNHAFDAVGRPPPDDAISAAAGGRTIRSTAPTPTATPTSP
ncbi:hypothetical protein [Streptomyces sp. NPDC014995]|uniref:hypothetical protein n=1 Tax=Streptomyces sp. NPDC014995 TaxID=3364936 RepID=UPI0037028738